MSALITCTQVARSFIDSAVLILCTSLNALGQKAAQAVAGTADFSQLRLRDQVRGDRVLRRVRVHVASGTGP